MHFIHSSDRIRNKRAPTRYSVDGKEMKLAVYRVCSILARSGKRRVCVLLSEIRDIRLSSRPCDAAYLRTYDEARRSDIEKKKFYLINFFSRAWMTQG